ncbi:MAG: tetratricopeptide repeat protein [Elusimicrobia bacterium]|nr:tetratricopeptide repeat protein [Elusimicrobiota bacterium]
MLLTKRELMPLVLLVLLVVAVFGNTLLNQFVYDDKVFVINNQFIKEFKHVPQFFTNARSFSGDRDFMIYRPLASLSLSLDHWLWALNPLGYHLTNIVLHTVNVLLVYWLVLSLASTPLAALLSAAIFAIHPAQCETVSWIASRSNLLCVLFLLLAFLAYLRNTRKHYYWSVLCFTLSLLAKETALIFVLVIALYDYYFVLKVDKSKAVNLWWSYLPILMISGLYLLLRTLVLGQVTQRSWWGGSLWHTMLTMGKSFFYYLKVIIIPWKLTVDYVLDIAVSIRDPLVLAGLGSAVALIVLALKISRRDKLFSFGLFWFLIALLPVSNLIPLEALLAERFLYLPLVGVSLAIVLPLSSLLSENRLGTKNKLWGYLLIAILLVGYGVRTIQRNKDWHDDYTLWSSTVRTSPESPRAHFALGEVYYKKGDYSSAIDEYERALELNPDVAELYNVLGLAYEEGHAWGEAISVYKAGLKAKSLTNRTKVNLLLNLGNAYSCLRQPDIASAYYCKVLELEPGNTAARHNLDLITQILK